MFTLDLSDMEHKRSIEMKITKTITETRVIIDNWKKQGFQIGFVPTMGYLHNGHASLIKKATQQNDRTVVSIFVNPMQFGPNEDLKSYPRNIEKDTFVCEQAGADLIFHPEIEELYPDGFCSYIDMSVLTERLCGAKRPGHFRGVCTVVMKFFHITKPNAAYFGQKDAQQLAVIQRMVKDLNMNIDIIGVPIIREPDGLALSSRNKYLNEEERMAAVCLNHALEKASYLFKQGEYDAGVIINQTRNIIEKEPLAKIDYIEIIDADTIQPVFQIEKTVLCAIAVYIGKTRLIDNCILKIK